LSNPIGVLKGKGKASDCNCVVLNNGNIVAVVSNSVVADNRNVWLLMLNEVLSKGAW